MASVPSLCSADTWVKAELVPAPQLDASPRGRGRGRGRLPPPGSGSHSCSLFSPPKLASPRLPPLLGRDPCYTPSLSPGRQLRAGEVRTAPSSSLEEPPLWLLADPLILPHAPWASLDLPRLLLLSATCSSPVPMSWPRARRGHSPGARPQRLRGLGLPCGRGSRWGPQAEPTGAGSSSTWLVLLALPPRAAQGERSCWGLAWSPVERPPPTDRAQAWGGTRTQGSAAPRPSAGLFLWTPGRVGVPGRAPFSLPALWPPWSPS